MNAKPARILIIAGSDSSGGAGIQADIKTATALACYAMTAITAVTVQNTTGVQAIHPIPVDIVREQISVCLSDIGVDAIKIGMLGGANVVAAVSDVLRNEAQGIPLVLDPVMVAKGGATLADENTAIALVNCLIPLATIVTPNIPEAENMVGMIPGADRGIIGRKLLAMGSKAVLIKGGHADGALVEDVLLQTNGERFAFTSPRLDTRHTHGTGCTLSTAIACGLGQGLSLVEAVARAHNYVQEAIRTAPGFGAGHGPLNHMHGKPV